MLWPESPGRHTRNGNPNPKYHQNPDSNNFNSTSNLRTCHYREETFRRRRLPRHWPVSQSHPESFFTWWTYFGRVGVAAKACAAPREALGQCNFHFQPPNPHLRAWRWPRPLLHCALNAALSTDPVARSAPQTINRLALHVRRGRKGKASIAGPP